MTRPDPVVEGETSTMIVEEIPNETSKANLWAEPKDVPFT